jgi:uncharacterized membrane protein YdjX (TVP38/TMEM64 family)
MAVNGEAAARLGELTRERWSRATGTKVPPPKASEGDPWPDDLPPDLESVDVAIARTEAAYKGREAVREVETLYRDSIAAARRWIYIENQYLTSKVLEESLAPRLLEPEGPEILIVLPRQCSGWLQETVMGNLRDAVLHKLRGADRHGRLRVYFPRASPSDEDTVMVHAKVMVVDDRLVRVGSANLSNRSMGLDSECDLAIESAGEERVERAVALFRNRLLAEHLGASTEEVAEAVEWGNSLIRAVETLQGRDHSLVPLPAGDSEWIEAFSTSSELLDPERPMELDHMIDEFVQEEEEKKGWGGRIKLALLICLLAGLALLWRFGPLGEWLNQETAVALAHKVAQGPAPAGYVILTFVAGGLVFLPVTAMIAATAAVFDPVTAFLYAMGGSMASATVSYWMGSVLGRDLVRRIAGRRLNRLSRRLAKRGFVSVFVVRMVPVAPFPAVNLVAGASHIRFRDFFFGTLAGMSPGIFGVTLLTDRVKNLFREPGLTSILSLLVVVVLLGLSAWFLAKRLKRRVPKEEEADADRAG